MTQAQICKETAARSTSAEPLLSLQDVSVWYPDSSRAIVRNVNLSVNEGDFVLFLGPSGCGKSTLSLACAGLIPSAVEGEVRGHVVKSPVLDAPTGTAMVFQDPDIGFCMLHVGDEVAFGLENQRVPRERMPAFIAGGLRTAGLATSFGSEHVNFSGGMKQKLAIASALAFEAPLLILDEPTANLDPLSTHMVFETIRRLKAAGQTMIVVEHKFDALLPFVDKVVLFSRDGQVHATGDAKSTLFSHWDWLIEEGVIPPWTEMPSFLTGVRDGRMDGSAKRRTVQSGFLVGVKNPGVVGAEAVISFGRVSVQYSGHSVWKDVSFSINKGAFVAVVGPNGSGKSTLLQTMAGLLQPTQGNVVLQGKSVKDWLSKDRYDMVSYCFQNPEFQFIFERVGDELASRVHGDDVPQEVLSRLREFGLEGTEHLSPFSLSQGQKRRLSVAVMLQDEHDLYILDEPTFGQDARTQQFIMEQLALLHQEGKTIVISTHDMSLVERYATQVLVLGEEGLMFQGTPGELARREDILRRAHLVADKEELDKGGPNQEGRNPEGRNPEGPNQEGTNRSVDSIETVGTVQDGLEYLRRDSRPFAHRLNPALHLLTIVAVAIVAMFSTTIGSSLGLFLLPIVVMIFAARMSLTKIIKRYAAFLLFYVLYLLSFVLFSRVPQGEPALRFLWWTVSWYGFHNGLVMALRMLSVAGFGILVLSVSDMTDLIVSLCQTLKVPPRMAYGALAGIRFIPLFQGEWRKLRIARMLRGREDKVAIRRPVTYALPLLSQAIRMSERVAIAMEARGFVGEAAISASGRTYFRHVPVRSRDIVYNVLVLLIAIGIVVFGNLSNL